MKFGIFDHLDRNDLPLRDYYESRLQIIEAYDRLGFYAYHVAEHHSTPLGMAASPSVFLSAIAQRTQRLRFGPMVYALPLYHPLRMIEEICMLDQMSAGRLEIGFGRGSVPEELDLLWTKAGRGTGSLCRGAGTDHQGDDRADADIPRPFFPVRRGADGACALSEAASSGMVRRARAAERRACRAQRFAGHQPRSARGHARVVRRLPPLLERGVG